MKKLNLKTARVSVGLTQKEMAKKLNVSRTTYVDYEYYKIPMRIDTAMEFCKIVSLALDEVIFFKEKPTLQVSK